MTSSYEEVTAILAQCRISHFRQAFLDNECDDSFLDIVEDGDLRELGLPLGPRVRLLKAVADRNAARAARAPAVTPTRTFAPPPPPPEAPAAPASPRNEDNLCELCADREVDCAIAGCEHKFCRVCVDLWRRESVPVWKSRFYGAFVLNHRVVLHAIDATPARWRGDAGSSPLDRARSAASSPRNDLVKNCRVHPTHRLISTQPSTCRGQSKHAASRASRVGCRARRRPGAPAAASGTSWARDPSTCGRTRAGSAGSRRGRASPGSAAGAAACPSAGARPVWKPKLRRPTPSTRCLRNCVMIPHGVPTGGARRLRGDASE